ncbi:type III polyketide synthase [Marinoscillum furvescens]|uniref:Putative naringenin-chalcone synthase n=1 Tax=Marinoscillum furvescens DSM 4134 TaxID=1122208 RepID=A0A3D9L450_MARFU|nr:type III polyketide synthase [Marinoscillum furvescens]REE00393.1 putative naringenin-chalcone synthase [Marinoscillum furvescens DSM 4134]
MPSYITSIHTAVPDHRISQQAIREFMIRHLATSEDDRKRIELLYRASGIQYRHSVLVDFDRPPEDFTFFPKNHDLEPFPKVSDRMQLYQREAIKLCEKAASSCLRATTPTSITHLITVSCTGMYAPGIDIELVERLGMHTNVQRTSVNFMGCYAAFNALKVANEIAQNQPDSKILIVAVELCSIHLLKETDEDSLLSGALFGDGAAAVLVEGRPGRGLSFQLDSFYADLAPEGKDMMAWHISDFGFQMKLTHEVPEVIKKGIGELTGKLLSTLQKSIADIDHFAIHPGGKRILEVIEEELGIDKAANSPAYDILKNYGNMSSPTVLFVLHRIMQQLDRQHAGQHVLSFAFGPGLTMESMLLKIVHP